MEEGQGGASGRRIVSARKRACVRIEEPETTPSLEMVLRMTIEELCLLRKERAERRSGAEEQRGSVQQSEEHKLSIPGQSNPILSLGLGLKLKPDIYMTGVFLCKNFYLNLIARTNRWGNSEKVVILASCLRGKAHSVLEGGTELENSQYSELVSRLELGFGEKLLAQNYYMQFINRKQKFGEDLAALGSEVCLV
ncbi:hypothetical protein P5V15_010212 [Pogonomyrmex californicus]